MPPSPHSPASSPPFVLAAAGGGDDALSAELRARPMRSGSKPEYLKAPYGWPTDWSFTNFVLLIENYDIIRAATATA